MFKESVSERREERKMEEKKTEPSTEEDAELVAAIEKGDEELVKEILQKEEIDVNFKDKVSQKIVIQKS